MKTNLKVSSLKSLLYLIATFVFIFSSCSGPDVAKTVTGELLRVDSINAPVLDQSIDSIISIYRQNIDAEMNQLIASSPFAMHRGSPEGLLNNFVADLVLEKAMKLYQPADNVAIDFCLLNYGGLRSSLPKGDITIGNVFELMPFDNTIMIITLSGEKTSQVFDYLATETNGMPIAGLRMGIKNNKPVNVEIGGQPFDPNRNYKVVTSDYLAQGGDRMNFFLEPNDSEVLGIQIRDAIILHMKNETAKGNEIFSKLDGRLYIE